MIMTKPGAPMRGNTVDDRGQVIPGTAFECLVDELHAVLGDVVVEGVSVVSHQFNVGKRVFLGLTVER